MPEPVYKRLTRIRTAKRFDIAIATRSSLWLGEDHLLLVECSGATETYKRFYFRDIQAIIVRKTNSRVVWNWILSPLAGLAIIALLVDTFANPWKVGWIITSAVFLLLFGIPLLLNNLFGNSCACQIRTAVQTGELPSLSRLRTAHKVLNQIRPLIAAAQGQISGAEVSARMLEMLRAESSTGSTAPAVLGGGPSVLS